MQASSERLVIEKGSKIQSVILLIILNNNIDVFPSLLHILIQVKLIFYNQIYVSINEVWLGTQTHESNMELSPCFL